MTIEAVEVGTLPGAFPGVAERDFAQAADFLQQMRDLWACAM